MRGCGRRAMKYQAIWCNTRESSMTLTHKIYIKPNVITRETETEHSHFDCHSFVVGCDGKFFYNRRATMNGANINPEKIHFSPQKAIHQDPRKTRESFKIFTEICSGEEKRGVEFYRRLEAFVHILAFCWSTSPNFNAESLLQSHSLFKWHHWWNPLLDAWSKNLKRLIFFPLVFLGFSSKFDLSLGSQQDGLFMVLSSLVKALLKKLCCMRRIRWTLDEKDFPPSHGS